ncbi:hypothetical protein K2173_003866 [Erythroxylum novogranatense]|uniref:Uncharacterized protein n=1 Tax=Erythroxylum novogranatense TaxID=1862640 RepID=A0AAV8SJ30_9ROSI|nr:hypothetical protein K2173_003866 [Erythroxylum novogranatense]
MIRLSNALVTVLNCIFLVLGVALVGYGIYLHVEGSTPCHKFLQDTVILLGVAVSLLSSLGIMGSCRRKNLFLWLYLLLLLLLIIGLAVVSIFIFVVTANNAGKKDHHTDIGSFSSRLQKFITGKNWVVVRSCLADSQLCEALINSTDSKNILQRNFSPIQAGCCMPPANCGFKHVGGAYWRVTKSGMTSKNKDCAKWSNDTHGLCYDCNSCKRGFLSNIRKQWRHVVVVLLCVLVFTILVFIVSCCARKNNSKKSLI